MSSREKLELLVRRLTRQVGSGHSKNTLPMSSFTLTMSAESMDGQRCGHLNLTGDTLYWFKLIGCMPTMNLNQPMYMLSQ